MLDGAPTTFKSRDARLPDWKGLKYTLQVAVEDCTGCGICVDVCPARNKSEARLKAINMRPQPPLREYRAQRTGASFSRFPSWIGGESASNTSAQQQVQQPLFEFSGACAGCGETPYLKLLSQLFGDRLIVANATGCSSIYGGNLPTTPWAQNADGRGPAWSNSLFEDNAEFGLGFRVSLDKQREFAAELLTRLTPEVGEQLVNNILQCRAKGRGRHLRPARASACAEAAARRPRHGRRAKVGRHRRHAGAQKRLDCRRRWLGLRHRITAGSITCWRAVAM